MVTRSRARRPHLGFYLAAGLTLAGTAASAGAKGARPSAALREGRAVYGTYCLSCHGAKGDGRGRSSFLLGTRPRDFTSGVFKFRSTPRGFLPSDEDLSRTIRRGFPRYGMPSFARLSERERRAAVAFVKEKMRKSGRRQGTPVELGAEPPKDSASAARGRAFYAKFGCAACHGAEGRGDGPLPRYFLRAFTDADGRSTPPRNFSKGKAFFKSGGSRQDIVRTLATGLEGTRMVSFLPVLEDPKDLDPFWDIAAYIESIAEKGAPGRRLAE